ncbi:MAG: glycosyltransferase family 2 protein [Alphaproteobacteria bacterium]|nr:glycosyltransferase family 2 protein [Alphaproteobacteria bacterium]
MTTDRPLVSVVIPCYNASSTLAATLRSVLAQTYPAIEVIAVDDASRDGTLAILREFAAIFGDRLKIVALEHNRGSAGARNAGIDIAQGSYLALLDADDEWFPMKTARQVDHLRSHPGDVLVGCGAQEFLTAGQATAINGNRVPTIGPTAWRMMLEYSYFVPSMVMARMEHVRAIGGFDTRRYVVDDQDFLIRLAARGNVAMVPELLVNIGYDPMSLSHRNRLREPELVLPMLRDLFEQLGDRLSARDRRKILAVRRQRLGRNIYPVDPIRGLPHLLYAIARAQKPLENSLFLISASQWLAPLKRIVRRSR